MKTWNHNMQIIPAIDLIDGKCVRLTEGDYSQKTIYSENPVEVAKKFETAGVKRLHLVDLDGAKAGKVMNGKVLEAIANQTKLSIDFGGGIKTKEAVQQIFNSGAAFVSIGSIAVKNQALFLEWVAEFGAAKILLGADVRNEKIAVAGWFETTNIDVLDFIQTYYKEGIRQIFCTDISKDGKLQGIATELYQKILQHFPDLYLIASGGVSSLADVQDAKNIGCSGIIIGKALYENKIQIETIL